MRNMTLTNIATACNGKLYGLNTNTNIEVSGVVIDSRLVKENFLFIATVGQRVDGHNFIDSAFKQGAAAVLCEKAPTNSKGPYILVEDSFIALIDIATWYRMQLDIKVVGITGSVGKTSAKEFIASVLSQKYNVLKTEGNYNNEIGLPLTVLKIKDTHEIAVLEMGINHFGEMRRLSKIAKPDISVITNIGYSHLEFLGSRQGVLKAKTEIFDCLNSDGKVILNGDDDMLVTIQEVNGRKPILFGLSESLDVYANNIKSRGLSGSTCIINTENQSLSANIPIPGEHMIYNALAAAATGFELDISSEMILKGIQAVEAMAGRNNIIHHDKWTIIDDCYNANPVSMKAALDLLDMADTRKVAILGDMGELGDNEVDLHTKVGEYIATKDIDILICIGPLSKNIYNGATKNLNPSSTYKAFYYKDKKEFVDLLPFILNEGDTILVKASNFMGLNEIVEKLIQLYW